MSPAKQAEAAHKYLLVGVDFKRRRIIVEVHVVIGCLLHRAGCCVCRRLHRTALVDLHIMVQLPTNMGSCLLLKLYVIHYVKDLA
jgi:hypothetical protein